MREAHVDTSAGVISDIFLLLLTSVGVLLSPSCSFYAGIVLNIKATPVLCQDNATGDNASNATEATKTCGSATCGGATGEGLEGLPDRGSEPAEFIETKAGHTTQLPVEPMLYFFL